METTRTRLRVGDLARLAGVSVRTLHHYDDIGLLVPTDRTDSGYRTYDDTSVDRLRAILTYRELGLSLEEIAAAIDEDPLESLVSARQRLRARLARLSAIADALDTAITNEQGGTPMTPEEKLAIFGEFDPDEYAEEVDQRWGETEAFEESARRTSTYTKNDWQAIQNEASDIYRQFVSLMEADVSPASDEARVAVEAHRAHISRWFYECTSEIHKGLGSMYTGDPRFTANIDEAGEGLANYMSEAIAAAYA